MNYKEFQEMMMDYISDNLSIENRKVFEEYLKNNPQYQEEFEQMQVFWSGSEEEIPEPSTVMDVKFYTMLNASEKALKKVSVFSKITSLFESSFPKQLAYTLAILTVGFFIGKELNTEKKPLIEEVKYAQKETENVRSQLVLALLEQPSANKRLQAVNEANKLSSATETVIKALFTTLNKDANVNVRLSAVEALANYTDLSMVREGLIASIVHQKSPLVQIALADLMVVLQEKKAVKSFEKLIDEEDVNEAAKEKMKESIQQII
ncbi:MULTISPECIES: HEAT repeat domain-containing protein [unclassified Tenacibaculum]|uniref:HEAT repeat domain-containing protein n=1 Tax=unclassified Tenacibaculum TaxID=2635139 RepID=UPI001F319A29|nr:MULTISPECIES: HEAT repeat domain-containing protein [unclassified Tenacibaculum]MCF2876512.1 HEAT repeat domain-containing protein [Tenacibaculum sp. Cn5-1]MCF2936581.1 HEAT repeat domain-containing protein [Tenacibaculum sp. Cn5-34]MCG7511826.1 HEAT repeat domain-containing protein [Tenacibaculum sp. Cn5-46]